MSLLDPQFFHSLHGVDRLPRCLKDVCVCVCGGGEICLEPGPHTRASRCLLDTRELVCGSQALGRRGVGSQVRLPSGACRVCSNVPMALAPDRFLASPLPSPVKPGMAVPSERESL